MEIHGKGVGVSVSRPAKKIRRVLSEREPKRLLGVMGVDVQKIEYKSTDLRGVAVLLAREKDVMRVNF